MIGNELDDRLLNSCRAYLKSIDSKLNYVTPTELRGMIDGGEDIFILDNRSPEAFSSGHIEGAVNIWLRDALDDDNLAKLPTDRKIVVCCWVGHTASQLMTLLKMLGYDAVGLKYGMGEPAVPGESKEGWDECGFPTSQASTPK